MAQPNQQPKNKQQVQIKANDDELKGKYANTMQVMHTKEEFVMDFLNVFPPTGTLNARVIISPGHFKRVVRALGENLKKYEGQFGKIDETKDEDRKIGFM